MDRYDPNEWTKDFVVSNKSFCVNFLKDTNEQIIELVKKGDYKASIAGLDRMLNGLITMHNAGIGNCRPHVCGLSFIEGMIVACGLYEAPNDRRRDTALKAFMDARDYSTGGIKEFAIEAIDALESGISFEDFKEEFDLDFPSDAVNMLSDTTHRFDDLLNSSSNQQSGGCYVATAVYGSYDCPQVWTLRRYRDHTLSKTWFGRVFIHIYYAISPTLVKWFGNTKWFKKMWRGKLDRMVSNLQSKGIESTPYEDRNR